MWLQLVLVALLSASTISQAEIYDVTTIYDLDGGENASGHVHVRTNALGLVVASENGPLISENSEQLNLLCDASALEKCTWDIGNFSRIFNISEVVPEHEYEFIKNQPIFIGLKKHPSSSINDHIYICIKSHTIPEGDNLDFLDSPPPENFHLLKFYQYYSRMSVELYEDCYECDNTYGNYHFRVDTQKPYVCCSKKIDFSGSEQVVESDFIRLNFTGDELSVYSKLTLVKQIPIVSPTKMYFTAHFSGSGSQYIKSVFGWPVLKTTTAIGAEMVSPPLLKLKGADQICLTVVLKCYKDSRRDVLHVLARDLYSTDHFLHAVTDTKVGWNVKQIHINITKELVRPFRLVIRSWDKFSIARISSCSLDGEEVYPIEKSSLMSVYSKPEEWSLPSKYIYQAKYSLSGQGNDLVLVHDWNSNCQNGGVMTEAGCACPPGFTGSWCQTACGSNRFGHDCKGMCSVRTKMCQNLLMCNSATGCQCAPGYKQGNCSKECENGEYGNSCAQTCGHCLSGAPCDIYTGECQACEPGYVLPYCKEAYVYYASKPDLSSPDYGTITVKFNPHDTVGVGTTGLEVDTNTAGVGTAVLYQIQYRVKFSQTWIIYMSQSIQENADDDEYEFVIEEKIEGLETGYIYEVRIVLMDANFNKYDGDLIKVSEILTKCDIPDVANYNLKAESSSNQIQLSWSYVNETVHWCQVESYEVSWKEGWKWMTTVTQNQYFVLDNLLPNSSIQFKVRAKTNGGYAPSSELVTHTQYQGSHKVRDLRVLNSYTTSVKISWNPPKDDNRHLKYKITYECVEQLACPPGCVNATEGTFTQDETSVTLSPLLPFAQYYVTVAPEDGPQTGIYIGTSKTDPTEVPSLSPKGVLRTNTSLTVFWEPVPVCSSFHLGYKYHLLKESDTNKILASGSTKTLSATFDNLVASTHYSVRVFVVTIAGWNPNAFLDISTSTSATVPEAVRSLTVYKRARNSLGLRWAAPRTIYGLLKTFTVTYSLGKEEHSESVVPTACVPWPHLYCHTLQGLRANRNYNVSVSARNSEVAEDGAKSSVIGITKESPPSAPEGLKLTNSSSTSVSVEWRYPELPNGVIRSFLVSVEETEQFNQDDCCQVFPLVESPVQEELLSYNSEVSGLHPASTYFVSVSAKTIGLGPSQSLVVHTKPPNLPFSKLPSLELFDEATWLPQVPQPQMINNSEVYQPLIKAHFLLLVEENMTATHNDSGIVNPQLNFLLQSLIGKPFFFYTEYTEDNESVRLSAVPEVVDSGWGTCPQPSVLTNKSYKLVAVQVSEYGSEFNADLRYLSDPISLE